MNARTTLMLAVLVGLALPLAGQTDPPGGPKGPIGIEALHRNAIVWDCHNDLSYRVLYEGLNIGDRLPAGQVDIPRLREGGVDVQVVALFIQLAVFPSWSHWWNPAMWWAVVLFALISQGPGPWSLDRLLGLDGKHPG